MTPDVRITNHALQRWRERGATYANADYTEVVKAVLESTKVKDKDPVPFVRRPNTQYFYHSPTKCYFVIRTKGQFTWDVVTVILPGEFNLYIDHGRKRRVS